MFLHIWKNECASLDIAKIDDGLVILSDNRTCYWSFWQVVWSTEFDKDKSDVKW